jgi:hypothetical protein
MGKLPDREESLPFIHNTNWPQNSSNLSYGTRIAIVPRLQTVTPLLQTYVDAQKKQRKSHDAQEAIKARSSRSEASTKNMHKHKTNPNTS